MTLSITDHILPEARSFQFESNSPIAAKTLKFTAGRLTETLRIFASLVEQVALRTLYYTSYPTKWVVPSINNRLSSQLSASNQTLRNGIRNFATLKKPAGEKKLLSKPVALLERLQGQLPKISTRAVLTGVAIGVIGISLVYFGPSLFSKPENLGPFYGPENMPIYGPDLPPKNEFAGIISHFAPLKFEGTAGKELPSPKILMTEKIYNNLANTISQIPPNQNLPFEFQDGKTTCRGFMSQFGNSAVIESNCWQPLSKYTSIVQKQILQIKNSKEGTFEVDWIRKFHPEVLKKCLNNTCTSFVNDCLNRAKTVSEKLFCKSSDFQTLCSLKKLDQCAKEVGKIVNEYSPFKCLVAKDGASTCQFLNA